MLQMNPRVLAYATDADCAALPGGEPATLLRRATPMTPDGHLVCAGAAGEPAGRVVRPYLFLGRSADGRLAFLCEVLGQ